MKSSDYNILIADKPGRINTKFSNFNLHHTFYKKVCAQCPTHKQ